MKTPFRFAATAALSLALAILPWAGVDANGKGKGPTVPDDAFLEIVQEANKLIQEALAKHLPEDAPDSYDTLRFSFKARSNALLIALAAQNRMHKPGADIGKLAALRDAALKLVAAANRKHFRLAEVQKQAAVLNQYPNLKAGSKAQPELVRLRDHFDHYDDIAYMLFGGCGGRRGHAIQSKLINFEHQQTPITQDQAKEIELLAYKVALIGELLRDYDDDEIIVDQNLKLRKEWVRLSGDVQTTGWQLAESARSRDATAIHTQVKKLNHACASCHHNFW